MNLNLPGSGGNSQGLLFFYYLLLITVKVKDFQNVSEIEATPKKLHGEIKSMVCNLKLRRF